ncbi:MAG: 3-ketoacyl-ACP reductase [Candidatus Lokiarchaeota archaeon]|nr:3-ketoacyl-ACP reductase [Candidatus Lokiarchaeota archaeon]
MKLHDKKVLLVTGSTHGIGKAIILELAKLDFSVVINGAASKSLAENYYAELREIYQDEIENNFLYVQADISKKEDREILLNRIKKKFNRIDVLVNNAGVAPKIRRDILETSEESYDRVMSINLKGPYFLTQAISKWMIQLREELKDTYQPYIINISSINRYTASVNRGEYCLSKSAMNMMTKLFGERLAEYGIPVFEISPGIIDTPMTENVHNKYDALIKEGLTPIRRWGQPIDIAKPVIAIVSGLLPFSTGSVIDIDGGFHLHSL